MTARQNGERISDTRITLSVALGTSVDSFSLGCPMRFFLNPVILVLDNRQYPIHELACAREFPRDIQRRYSR
jgi:hypothetical protein